MELLNLIVHLIFIKDLSKTFMNSLIVSGHRDTAIFYSKIFKKQFPTLDVNGKINDLNLEHKEVKRIKKFLPSYNSKIILKDTEISFNQDSNLNLIGSIKFDKKFEDFSLSGSTRKHFKLNGTIGLTDLSLKIPKLN